MSEIFNVNQVYFLKGRSAFNVGGLIYFGVVDGDPVNTIDDRIAIFPTRVLSGTELPNPISTGSDGRTEYNGATVKVHVGERYSIFEHDSDDVEQYQDLDRGETPSSGQPISLENVQGINTITAEASTTITEYINDQIYILQPVSDNTTDVTLDIDGLGAVAVNMKGAEIIPGLFAADRPQELIYNSTGPVFEVVSGIDPSNPGPIGEGTPDSIKSTTPLGPLALTIFNSSDTWTRNAATKSAMILCLGSGGGGAGTSSNTASGGGGAAGASLAFVTSFSGDTDSVVIGAGGAGGVIGGAGGAGSLTNVGTLCLANGGSGSVVGGSGGGGANITGAIGDLTLAGANGGPAAALDTANSHAGGTGGGTLFGSGGIGGIGGSAGGDSDNPGAGGGGAGGTGSVAGGSGKDGIVIILEYA